MKYIYMKKARGTNVFHNLKQRRKRQNYYNFKKTFSTFICSGRTSWNFQNFPQTVKSNVWLSRGTSWISMQ